MKSLAQIWSYSKHYISSLLIFLSQLVLPQPYEVDTTIPFYVCLWRLHHLLGETTSSHWIVFVGLSIRWPPFSGQGMNATQAYPLRCTLSWFRILNNNENCFEFIHIVPWRQWPGPLGYTLVSVLFEPGFWAFIRILELLHICPIPPVVSIVTLDLHCSILGQGGWHTMEGTLSALLQWGLLWPLLSWPRKS